MAQSVEALEAMASDRPTSIIQGQRHYFATGTTRDIAFRIAQLTALRQAVIDYKVTVLEALQADLHKPEYEAYALEVGVLKEIDFALKRIRSWVKPKRVPAPPEQWPGQAWIQPEPLGVVLIIGPWNYPFQLVLAPLIGAIAAGNCAVLKPSELAPHTSSVLAEMIAKTFPPEYIAVVEGGVETSQSLLEHRFDHIFFTGGTAIGRVVMAAAAKHLTPVTLELGGKSPCIVDADVQLEHTARRIAWGKFVNAGQSCIAPDYVLVNRQVKPAFVKALVAAVSEFYGDDPAASEDYGRIISPHHTQRLAALLQEGTICLGGQVNVSDRYVAPTLLEDIAPDAAIMQEEIFGPILPILEYDQLEEAIALINARPKPLALYVFSRNRAVQQQVLKSTSSGGVCINDTFMHAAVSDLPFGGVGDSGMGGYHGKASFDTFSHYRSHLRKTFWIDPQWRYAPYQGKLDLLKKIIG